MQFSRLKRGRVYKHIGKGCYVFQNSLFYSVDGLKRLLCVMGEPKGTKWRDREIYFFRFEGTQKRDIGLRGARRGHHGFLTAKGYSYIGKGIFNA